MKKGTTLRDPAFIATQYRQHFKIFVDKFEPRVSEELIRLVRNYSAAFGSASDYSKFHLFDFMIANRGVHDEDYIMSELAIVGISEIKPFLEFRKKFWKLVDQYNLNADWLERDMFDFIGFRAKGAKIANLSAVCTTTEDPYESDLLSFNMRGWRIGEESTEEFKKIVKKQFDLFLSEYLSKSEAEARSLGYKDPRGRLNDPRRVKWLVWFTVMKWPRSRILAEIVGDSDDPCIADRMRRDPDTLQAAFNQFAAYGLPVRRD